MELTEGQCESMERIAMHCARSNTSFTSTRPGWGLVERFDIALDAVVEFVHDRGWPDDFNAMFRYASTAIAKESYEQDKHLRYGPAHYSDISGDCDHLAERVTDRIAAWQLAWQLTEFEWLAVWATAEVMKTEGGRAEAAALAGISVTQLSNRLFRARARCRPLWVCPGETPVSHYRPDGDGHRTRLRDWRNSANVARRRRQATIDREEAAA